MSAVPKGCSTAVTPEIQPSAPWAPDSSFPQSQHSTGQTTATFAGSHSNFQAAEWQARAMQHWHRVPASPLARLSQKAATWASHAGKGQLGSPGLKDLKDGGAEPEEIGQS